MVSRKETEFPGLPDPASIRPRVVPPYLQGKVQALRPLVLHNISRRVMEIASKNLLFPWKLQGHRVVLSHNKLRVPLLLSYTISIAL